LGKLGVGIWLRDELGIRVNNPFSILFEDQSGCRVKDQFGIMVKDQLGIRTKIRRRGCFASAQSTALGTQGLEDLLEGRVVEAIETMHEGARCSWRM
jgi:hypothetical protein